MSQRRDISLHRREAVSDPATTMDHARHNGLVIGYADRQQTATQLRLFVEDGTVWSRVSRLGDDDSAEAPVLTSTDPEVVRFVSELIGLFPTEGEPVGPK